MGVVLVLLWLLVMVLLVVQGNFLALPGIRPAEGGRASGDLSLAVADAASRPGAALSLARLDVPTLVEGAYTPVGSSAPPVGTPTREPQAMRRRRREQPRWSLPPLAPKLSVSHAGVGKTAVDIFGSASTAAVPGALTGGVSSGAAGAGDSLESVEASLGREVQRLFCHCEYAELLAPACARSGTRDWEREGRAVATDPTARFLFP